MTNIYNEIIQSKVESQKLLAILLDPDKVVWENLAVLISKINQSPATHIFIGGSLVTTNILDDLIVKLKQNSTLPIVLFPGNPSQISTEADAILFLSLISGRNPDYLIEHQVNAVPILKQTDLEVISTGYILIESGNETAVERVSKTKPLDRNDIDYVIQTAQAGEMLGNKLIYLEAGSGAKQAVPLEMIKKVAQNIEIPLVVGGGIVNLQGIQKAYHAGADLVVIGTAFENDINFFD
ncbi:phosphoglycerol geranylgeranyltransferase [Flavobacterium gawalongense]|uniref:Geranylgeranylglyceryl phosphate synthase n=1 Tax=Flavobacterium gawalongense TaxID=2594432 RepID=A0A553BXB9_9FLAO|nr:geranylgeranylglyceryl/heptaprenylglyceryl phosphate synthase [Flavobacterium gawalongense]TRX04140.1 geranylgeranylglyceryl/heptaprenylglyceryl phosphate synthase [Flavobacterium gawalongense]TRX09410.1 geranylgeranylglyceryl/heptaprenylglyceryl phosphate synthase [Flavobacterium gawalongense]TRX12776.1 geranylgeranylglyceryl/heptaprenylglyceryl phosphate synthase [Flavobacterium gawalongense]TRX13121.1 geranylgeranylglyceryl/heptaprenylglyceryl phosphate synthase [Flavobacterium gawalongen